MTSELITRLWKMTPAQVSAYKKEAMARIRAGTMSVPEANEFVEAFDELNERWKAVRKSQRKVLHDGFIDPDRSDHAPYFQWLRDHDLLREITEFSHTVH